MKQEELRKLAYKKVSARVHNHATHTDGIYYGTLTWRYGIGNTMLFAIEGTEIYGELAANFKEVTVCK